MVRTNPDIRIHTWTKTCIHEPTYACYVNKSVNWHFYLLNTTEACPGTNLRANMTLNFVLPERKFQIALLPIKENNCAKYFEIQS